MNKKNERLLLALGEVDEKYVKEAGTKMPTRSIVKIAMAVSVVIALALYLFIPFGAVTSDLSEYKSSAYFSLIEKIDNYRLSFMQPKYKNNYEAIADSIQGIFGGLDGGLKGEAGSDSLIGGADGGSGNYVEATDNQVDGVIESDLFKMSDKYIFRLNGSELHIYSIEKENSTLVSSYSITTQNYFRSAEMYLSEDCTTVTVLLRGYEANGWSNVVSVVSIDVSDVENVKEKGRVSIEGELKTSRMVDGKLLLVTEYYFNRGDVDYNNPSTFVPSVDDGKGKRPIEFENIIYPENVENTRYSVVALVDTEDQSILDANALLNFTSDIYVSTENLFITREYTERKDENGKYEYTERDMTEVAVIKYSDGSLESKGSITVNGRVKDQYSFDERDGYLRVVTSTRVRQSESEGDVINLKNSQNVSLYIFELSGNTLAYSVENFAIEGEEAVSVRFDGDKLYVCTAVVVTFTDPVYFFDLSDYENITSTDTGVIDGFSTSLINLGEGFLLGIGEKDWRYGKVEVYEERGGKVVSVDEYKLDGSYSQDYKAYLVNREENLFGFSIYQYVEDANGMSGRYEQRYILLGFDGYKLNVLCDVKVNNAYSSDLYRAACIDGYLYVTSPDELFVEKIR